jgi:hypothetical protein
VHRFFDVAGRNVYIGCRLAGLVGDDESEAAGMRFETADDEIHLVGQPDAAAFGFDELAGCDERFEQPPECRALFLRNVEDAQQFARCRGVRDFVTHEFENLFFV